MHLDASTPYIKSLLKAKSKGTLDLSDAVCLLAPVRTISSKLRVSIDNELSLNSLPLLKKTKYFSEFTEFYFNSNIGLLGPLCGAPSAVLTVEQLLILGAKKIVLVSVAGGVAQHAAGIQIGDLILPTGAINFESITASRECHPLVISTDCLQKSLENHISASNQFLRDAPILKGLICSTDFPNTESPNTAELMHRHNVIAVEMEYYALIKLCNDYDAQLSAIFTVSDLLGETWKRGFSNTTFLNSLVSVVEIIKSFAISTIQPK